MSRCITLKRAAAVLLAGFLFIPLLSVNGLAAAGPDRPGSFRAAAITGNRVMLSWRAVAGAEGYQVHRAESKNGRYTRVRTTSTLTFTDSKLTAGRTYFYKVRAFRAVRGERAHGAFSGVREVTVPRASGSGFFQVPDNHMTRQFNGFYNSRRNSIDVMFFGSSSVDRYWCSPVAFNDYGIAGYALATHSQSMVATRYLIEEALRTQSPRLLVIDIRRFTSAPSAIKPHHFQQGLDRIQHSPLRLRAVEDALRFVEGNPRFNGNHAVYYQPGRLLGTNAPGRGPGPYKCFYSNKRLLFRITNKPVVTNYTNLRRPIDRQTEAYIHVFLNYLDTLDIEVLFTSSPYGGKTARFARLNTVTDVIRSRGYRVLCFNSTGMLRAVGLDLSTDFYNSGHVNINGALKYTDFLARHIKQNYKIPNRRGNARYSDWNQAYNRLRRDARKRWDRKWGTFSGRRKW